MKRTKNKSYRMSHLDAALFALETPTNHMHLGLLALFEPATDGRDIADLLRARLNSGDYEDLRLVVRPSVLGFTAPLLIDGGPLDLGYHVQSHMLNTPGDQATLDAWVGRELSHPLDRRKPLWQLHVLTGLEGGGFALFLKGHHGVMDGPAALRTAVQILDGERANKFHDYNASLFAGRGGRVGSMVGGLVDVAKYPARIGRLVVDRSRHATHSAHLAAVPKFFRAPRTPINRSLSASRAIARADLSLADFLDIRREANSTVTDVVIADVAGAVRRLLEAKKALPKKPLIAIVPAAMTGDDWRKRSGNRLALEFVSMATDIEKPRERLSAIAHSGRDAREAVRLRGGDLWERYAGVVLPGPFHWAAVFAEKLRLSDRIRPLGTLIVSNLTGPRTEQRLGGAKLTALYGFGPPKDGGALNVTMISYNNQVFVGVAGDRALASDLQVLASHLEESLQELKGPVAISDRTVQTTS